MKKISQWFTLVELLVSVMVLAIVSAIWFVSYSKHLTWSRDSARIAAVSNFERIFEIHKVNKWIFSTPTDAIDITYSGSTIWQQGFVWDSVYEELGQSKNPPLDPRSKKGFDYSISANKQEYNIAYILESKEHSWEKMPVSKVIGNYNWYFLQSENNLFALPSLISSDISETDLWNLYTQWKILSNNSPVYPATQNTNTPPSPADVPNKLVLSSTLNNLWDSFINRLELLQELQQAYSSMKAKEYDKIKSYNIFPLLYDEAQLKFVWNLIFKAVNEPRLKEYKETQRYFLFLDGHNDQINIPDFNLESDFEISMLISPRNANYTLLWNEVTTDGVLSISGNNLRYGPNSYELTYIPELRKLNSLEIKSLSGALTVRVNDKISYIGNESLTPKNINIIGDTYYGWTNFAGILADVRLSSWWQQRFYKLDDNNEYLENSQLGEYSSNLVTTNNLTTWDGTESNYADKLLWWSSVWWKTYRVDLVIKNYVSGKIRAVFWANNLGFLPDFATNTSNLVYYHTPTTGSPFRIQTSVNTDRFIWDVEVYIKEAKNIWILKNSWDSSWFKFMKKADDLWYSENLWNLGDVTEDGTTWTLQMIEWEWWHTNDTYLEPYSDYIYSFSSSNHVWQSIYLQVWAPRVDIIDNLDYKWVINSGGNMQGSLMFISERVGTKIDIKNIVIQHVLQWAK